MSDSPSPPLRRRRWAASSLIVAALLLGNGCQTLHRNSGANDAQNASSEVIRASYDAQNHDSRIPTSSPVLDPTKPRPFTSIPSVRQEMGLYMNVGREYQKQGRFGPAAIAFDKASEVVSKPEAAVGRDPITEAERSEIHRRLAASYDGLGQFAKSADHYRRALELTPRDPKVHNDLGYSYYLQQRWDEAEVALRHALKLEPDRSRTQINLGLTLAASGKVAQAIEILAAAQGPAAAHANVGYVLAALGRHDQARRHYAEAGRIQPSLGLSERALAQLPTPRPASRALPDVNGPANSTTQVASTKPPSYDPAVANASREAAIPPPKRPSRR